MKFKFEFLKIIDCLSKDGWDDKFVFFEEERF